MGHDDRNKRVRGFRLFRPWFGMEVKIGLALLAGLAFRFGPQMAGPLADRPASGGAATTGLASAAPPKIQGTTAISALTPAPAAAKAPPPVKTLLPDDDIPPPAALASAPKSLSAGPDPAAANPDPLAPPKLPDVSGNSPKPEPMVAASEKAEKSKEKKTEPLALPDDSPVWFADLPADRGEKDALKPAKGETKGPIHPYFRRYLERKEYYVRAGDDLATIALRLYGEESKAEDIRKLNKDVLGGEKEPKPGTTLKLP
jgi:nucleoid-associated protein YgaU